MTDQANIDEFTGERTGIAVRVMTRSDILLVDDLLADAFTRNSITRLMFGDVDPGNRLRILNRRMVRHRHGSGLIAEVDGNPAGALLASDHPHCEPDGIAGFGFLIDAIRTMRFRILTTLALFRETARNHPKWPHRHLTALGVSSAYQRTGVGSALLREFCRQADVAGVSCYLETDSEGGRRLYERFGFSVTNQTMQEKVPFIFMWRQARKPILQQELD